MFNLGTGIGSSLHNGEFKVDPDALKQVLMSIAVFLKDWLVSRNVAITDVMTTKISVIYSPQEKAFYRSARMPFQAKTQENERKGYLAVVQSL